VEIERKFTVVSLPENLEQYPVLSLEQGYMNFEPVIRIRKENDAYYLTYKGKGLLAREEYNLPLNEESYERLLPKCEGNIISKKRYLIPFGKYTIELDVFEEPFAPLVIAEVEFPNEEEAESFSGPDWFGQEVTYQKEYHNSNLAQKKMKKWDD